MDARDELIAVLQEKLRVSYRTNEKLHRRVQAMEGVWQSKLEGARQWGRHLQDAYFSNDSERGAAFAAGQAVEREYFLALLRQDASWPRLFSQVTRDRITLAIREGKDMGIAP